jgi:hypothetical protein
MLFISQGCIMTGKGNMHKQFILPVIITVIVSSFTLWLVASPIKYFFFAFQVILTLIFTWVFVSPQSSISKIVHIKLNANLFESLNPYRLDLLFLFLAATLLVINLFQMSTPANILLSFIVISLLPGYVIMRLTGVFDSISYIEGFVLCFAISLAVSGLLPAFFMPISVLNKRLEFLSLLTFFSVLPILKRLFVTPKNPPQEKGFKLSLIGLLTLLLVGTFFVFTILYLYPKMSLVPGLDIVRDFANARLLSISPDLLSSAYPFFITYESAIYSCSLSSLQLYQTFLAFVSVFTLLSFYTMAKEYLSEIDRRLPFFATIFWTVFSGFGWIYVFTKKIEIPSITQESLLNLAYNASDGDIQYGMSTNLWLWFIAMTASFTIFFTLLYLLKRKGIPKFSLMLLIFVLTTGLYFIHISEAIIFILLIVSLAILGPVRSLNTDEALYSTFVMMLGLVVLLFLAPIFYLPSEYIYSLALGLTGIVGLTCIYRLIIKKEIGTKPRSQLIKTIVFIFGIFFIAGLLIWPLFGPTFSTGAVGGTDFIPWFFYPFRLGIIGILGLLGTYVIAKWYTENSVVIFPFLFFIAWLVGRGVSFVNVNLFRTGYYELRFLFFSFAAASIAVAILLKHIRLKVIRTNSLGRKCLCSLLIGFLVLAGISSTFLTIEQNIPTETTASMLDNSQLNAISFLSSVAEKEKPAPLLAVTIQSAKMLQYVPSPWIDTFILPVIWSPKSPEIPLAFVYNQKFPSFYLVLQKQDLNAITDSEMHNGYLGKYFLNLTSEIYNSFGVNIYNASGGVPPLLNGKSVLIVPSTDPLPQDALATYMLSNGGFNYTTMLKSDPEISGRDTLIFSSDSMTTQDINNLVQGQGKKIIILNLDGFGPLSSSIFEIDKTAKINATSVITPQASESLPTEIEVTSLIPKEGVPTLCWYSNDHEKIPLVTVLSLNNRTELFYLNVFPMVSSLVNNKAGQNFLRIITGLLDLLSLPKYDNNSVSWVVNNDIPVFAFKSCALNGNISLDAENIIPFEGLDLQEVSITIDNRRMSLENVTSLMIKNTKEIHLSSQNMTINNGLGFYALINSGDPKIVASGEEISVSALSSNGNSITINGSGTADILVKGNFLGYMRNPHICSLGVATFVEAYAFHSYLSQLNTLGQNLVIKGSVEFDLPLADVYSLASGFTWTGTTAREPKAFTWDELGSLKQAIPYFVVILSLSVFVVIVRKYRIRFKISR